jgi:MraZ protein
VFIGHSKHVFDPQTLRVIIPSKLRDAVPADELKEGFIAAVGLDGCLALYTTSGWRTRAARTVNMGEFDARMFQRMLFGTAERVHCDAQGRCVLPRNLVDLLGLKEEVVVCGADDRIEIWPAKRWADVEASQRLFYEQMAKSYYGGPAAPEWPEGAPAPAVERGRSDPERPSEARREGASRDR